VWVGASADGLFTGVAAAGVAVLAVAARRPAPAAVVTAFAAGGLLGAACFLSYGLVLLAPVAAAVLCADLSGLSKAEVERIWLPFAVWLVAGTALLPAANRRWWLAGQAATALAVNHLLLTGW
jgi:hypothetical protein